MGEFEAGKTLIGLSVYFLILIMILFLVKNFAIEYGLDYDVTSSANESALLSSQSLIGGGVCNDNRIFYNPVTSEFKDVPFYNDNSISCEYSRGSSGEAICNAISGCSWNITTHWFSADTAGCEGFVNISAEYNYTGEVVDLSGTLDESLYDQINSKDACQFFGYEWTDSSKNMDVSFATITGIMGSLFTYNATFSDDFIINLILTTILFYMPFLILLVALYFALPFLH